MTTALRQGVVTLALATGSTVAICTPALASSQVYAAPGFPSANASCTRSVCAFGAPYGTTGGTFPTPTHGQVGPTTSGHATTDGPGAAGAFSSTLAQSSGPVWTCF
jgi:hypothetical protein